MLVAPQQIRDTRAHAEELKFFIDLAVGAGIAEWARARLAADPHGAGPFLDEYQVTSLYFDTEHHDVLNGRGSFGRSKYRVRRYGPAEVVFLERKLRRPGLLHKRRSVTLLDDLGRLGRADATDVWPGRWFHRRLVARRLEPVCQLSYHRLARVLPTGDGLIRLTLDTDIRVQATSRVAFGAEPGLDILQDQTVLELKYRRALPAIFKDLVERFSLAPTAGSKYRFGMAALGHRAASPASTPRAAVSRIGGIA